MITVYFTHIKALPDAALFRSQLCKLPDGLKNKISGYRSQKEQMLRYCGKAMLPKLFERYNLFSYFSFRNMEYNERGKPFFKKGPDHNISHSGDIVVCAGLMNANIGVDVEKVTEADNEILKDHFTESERAIINCSENRNEVFYKMCGPS